MNPYRNLPSHAPKVQSTIEVETNDMLVEVFYLDIDNTVKTVKREFIGEPEATLYKDSPSPSTNSGRGSAEYAKWLGCIGRTQLIELNDLVIPASRLLKITSQTKVRTQQVNIEIR